MKNGTRDLFFLNDQQNALNNILCQTQFSFFRLRSILPRSDTYEHNDNSKTESFHTTSLNDSKILRAIKYQISWLDLKILRTLKWRRTHWVRDDNSWRSFITSNFVWSYEFRYKVAHKCHLICYLYSILLDVQIVSWWYEDIVNLENMGGICGTIGLSAKYGCDTSKTEIDICFIWSWLSLRS